jgi:hypothetical protein
MSEWQSLDSLKAAGQFPREVIVAAWNGEKYTVSQACAFEDGAFRWCWQIDLEDTVADDCFDVEFWQPLPEPPSKQNIAPQTYSHPAPGDRGGGRAESNEGDTLEGVIVHDDDTRGCAQS